MIQRELDARVASIQYTETADLNLPAIEVAGDAFEAGAEWADRTMIDRVCEWLDSNLERYVFEGINGKPYISIVLCDDLRNAMNSDNH